ncbi:vitamin B6 photo-protection and homoeostasis-domain-containing protein [Collybia nuda]|uniref:Vitamin B6 photo-protection and homoeostasis-domain-containing protein n=1 Tax=Collybia nuda TaxID=64659 RepID=A0A9P6CFF3_9AGAR|nr:vitamin B6 photo-protection and homoeostasis-domain-containing protein [Collybia nuda]
MAHNNETEKFVVTERDDIGRFRRAHVMGGRVTVISESGEYPNRLYVLDVAKKVFLPSGYPSSVSPDYLRYQILNALQAFCSSLSGLLSSRAVLEGFGVGDPTASATHALLLTIVQDVFSRMTTIFGAYAFGSSLVPEAKTYRFVADILNDTAIILDTLSPLPTSPSLPFHVPGLRVGALCLSASLRALCGIAAGGSKAAISLHFATPIDGSGDVGDLNAKDSSKETVLVLMGMLLGSLIVPRLTSAWSTYTALFSLVGLHLAINYIGVRGLILRSLNRQRAAIAWNIYRTSGNSKVPTPTEISRMEKILGHPALFRDPINGSITGQCTIGSSFSDKFHAGFPSRLFELFAEERYLLWYDRGCLQSSSDGQNIRGPPILHIFFKDGYTVNDQLRAWLHAAELCRLTSVDRLDIKDAHKDTGGDEALRLIHTTLKHTLEHFSDFIKGMRSNGWNTTDIALMTGPPKTVLTRIDSALGNEQTWDGQEDKKIR